MNKISGGQTLARILGAVEGFYVAYGCWPSTIRVSTSYIQHLRNDALPPETLLKVTEKLALIPDESATVVAEDANGQRYDYGLSGFPKTKPPVRARDWLCLRNG